MVVKYEVDNSACEIGYCIGSALWNKGYSTEALQAVIDFLFVEVGLNRISAKHDILNPASGEVMKKCKMTHEGILRDVQFKNNKFCTLAVYSILKREWDSETNKKSAAIIKLHSFALNYPPPIY